MLNLVRNSADRLVGMLVPQAVARATDCDYECCPVRGYWRRCCYRPNGTLIGCSGCGRNLNCG